MLVITGLFEQPNTYRATLRGARDSGGRKREECTREEEGKWGRGKKGERGDVPQVGGRAQVSAGGHGW
jgi:hypothetical protein